MVFKEKDVEYFVEAITASYGQLSKLLSLSPQLEVNQAFTKLVGLCSQIVSERVVAKVKHSRMAASCQFPQLTLSLGPR